MRQERTPTAHQDSSRPLREDPGRPRPHPEARRRHVPDLLDVHRRLRLRQRRDGPARGAARPPGPQRAHHALREVGRRQRHGRAAHGPPAAPLRASASPCSPRSTAPRAATMLALGRRRDRDGSALLPHRGRHLARARPLARRPHEPPRGGEQRRGGPRDPALEGDRRTAGGRQRQPVPGALQVPPSPGDRRPRPREQPVPDALPRDPRLPHEGRDARPSASAAG